MKKLLSAFSISMTAILLSTTIALAAYTANITLHNTSSTSYDMYPATLEANVSYMAANGFFTGTEGLDTRVLVGTVAQPHMLASDRINFATSVNANSDKSLSFTTGSANLSSFPIITGFGGNVTVSDAANLEFSGNATTDQSVYVDTDNGTNKHLLYKENAYDVYVSPTVSGNITYDTYDFVSPQSATGTTWVWDDNAVDEDTATTANYTFGGGVPEWSAYLTATLDNTLAQTRLVRFWVTRSNSAINKIEIDIYYSGGWHNIYSANPTWGAYVEVATGGEYSVSQIRIRGYNSSNNNYILYCHEYEPLGEIASVSTNTLSTGGYNIRTGFDSPFSSIGIDATTSPITPISEDLVYNLPFRQTEFNTSGDNFTSIDTFQHECDPVNPVWSATGYSFDGSGDWVALPSSTINATEGTFILWVWFDRDNTAEYLFSENGGELALYHNGSKELRLQYDGVGEINTNLGTAYKDPYTGEWMHLGITFREGSWGRLYVNNSMLTQDNSINAGGFTPAAIKIGAYSSGANAFQGDIGEFVYYDVRDVDLITRHYEATKAHFTSGEIYTNSGLGSPPDNTNDIMLWTNNVCPYADNISISVGGVEQLYYAPNAIVDSDGTNGVLPDRGSDGTANTGNITWGSNVADISIDLGMFTSDYEMYAYTESEQQDVMPAISGKGTSTDAARDAALSSHLLYPIAEAIETATSGHFTAVFQFQMGLMVLSIILFVLGYFFLGENLIIGGVLSCIPMGYGVTIHAYDWWIIPTLVLWLVGCVILEGRRTPG